MMAEARQKRLGSPPKDAHAKIKPGRSAMVDDVAVESDEDGGWGPTGGDPDNDEDGEEGEDAFVPDLVDDQAIDEETKKAQDELADQKRR
jgi:mediator of replication checkpoint protein 1